MSTKTLYQRLGGYDAIVAVSGDLLPRLMSDSRLKRFWDHLNLTPFGLVGTI